MIKILFYIIKTFYAFLWIGDVLDFPILDFMDNQIPINAVAWTVLIIIDIYLSSIIITAILEESESNKKL